ncbi:MAG TPA: M28 family peptidase [Gemmatimonadaceae bacterium]|nr:M28 family peptidase [Gemmatimonadaceae bacterium]
MPYPRKLLLALCTCAALTALSACDRLPFAKRAKTAFAGDSALSYARQQVAFGPRVPGTPQAQRAGDWIVQMMKARADTVIEQRWTHTTADGKQLPLRNILARFRPEAPQRILYLTHWDTRPTADLDPILGNRGTPIPGANDGAAGVGLLIALGDALKKSPPSIGVDLLFVDGEDYGKVFEAPYIDVLLGSQYFAEHLPSADYRPIFGVLWDMIGDAQLNILQEGNSARQAPEVVSRVWQKAAELGYEQYFIPRQGYDVTDDHVPLLNKGLRVIDVIDLDYGPLGPDGVASPNYHHTLQDTIDKVSAKSLQIVGDVALALVSDER